MAAIRMWCRGGFGRNVVVVAAGFPFFRVAVLSALLGLATVPSGHAIGNRVDQEMTGAAGERFADPDARASDSSIP